MIGDGSDCPSMKEQYTKTGAQEAARRARQSGDGTMKSYRCQICECFHIGHRRRSESKRARGANR